MGADNWIIFPRVGTSLMADTIPSETVPSRPRGLPITTIRWPTRGIELLKVSGSTEPAAMFTEARTMSPSLSSATMCVMGYVSRDDLTELLNACPSYGWKLLIALCRLEGLRRGEALGLTWDAIDWDRHRLTVIAEKTGRLRIVPIEPDLYEFLLEAFEQAEEGEERICPICHHGLWRNLQTIRRRAGLPKWKDAFQVMRKNCETDWAQKYPQYAVSRWIGHDIRVSDRHYLQVPHELYDKVAGRNSGQTATKNATKPLQTPDVEIQQK